MIRRLSLLVALLVGFTGPAGASSFTLETSAFLNDGDIPATDAANADHCGGRNISPPLLLTGFPANTRSLAVVVLDTDGNGGRGFVHWVAYGIKPSAASLPPGFGSQPSPAFTGGTNDPGTTTYFGPCPPPGDKPHRYQFTLFAVDVAKLDADEQSSGAVVGFNLHFHSLAKATLTGSYGH